MKFADVIVDISSEKLDKPFEYIIPDRLAGSIYIGTSVIIPFGNGDRKIQGYVIGIKDNSSYPKEKLKEIDAISKKQVSMARNMINLAYWIKVNYGSTMNQALKTVLPAKEKVRQKKQERVMLSLTDDQVKDKLESYEKKHASARLRLLKALIETREIDKSVVKNKLNISQSTLSAMEEAGDITVIETKTYRSPVEGLKSDRYSVVLNDEQARVSSDIKKSMDRIYAGEQEKYDTHLIFGITGSGKTEVYIDLIDHALNCGKSAIVLIPEIALTYQTVRRFAQKFGDSVTIVNSKMSRGEKYDQFERAKSGDVRVMIGPRSAVFTPFENLGLIVVDEEHEDTYKSESVPRYNAVEVARRRAVREGAAVILGSATPSVDSYYNASRSVYRLHKLEKREKGKLPTVEVIDLKEELKAGNKSIFSRRLCELISDRLEKGQQTILFLNRRGLAGFVSCRDCGKSMKCPHCDVTLKLHSNKTLVCHYCGYKTKAQRVCPECGSLHIGRFGVGTQQVERNVKELFPRARVLRMDADTTALKGSHQEILQAFANREADILVGTQMIVKGHDFPNVTLVGIIAADMSLNAPDYRAAEKTFQLLTQAAGRAGRGERPGTVVIQTYSPDNYSIAAASRQDYEEFYDQEITFRKIMDYPPVSSMLSVMLSCPDEDMLKEKTDMLAGLLRQIRDKGQANIMIIGPAAPSVAKINDIYRQIIYIKSQNRTELVRTKNYIEAVSKRNIELKDINVTFDFNA